MNTYRNFNVIRINSGFTVDVAKILCYGFQICAANAYIRKFWRVVQAAPFEKLEQSCYAAVVRNSEF
jgi:hypothetical protein